ncbi:MAG: hypothetical protein BM485_15970 [Desulfobulbaceae bacterium DB1]|nr:MAG: hypothetical protein BM485_15970 [Desulfobulbaceae bacterium DB1]
MAGLKNLSPELQKKIKELAENPLLPVWHEETRGVPNPCLRSALFGVIQRGRRKAVKGELVAAVKGLDIRYTGWRLDQGDFDVLAHALHLASRQQEKSPTCHVQFSAKGFLRAIGRKFGKSGRDWLKDSLRRLTASAVEIKAEIRYGCRVESCTYAGSLIDEFYYNARDKTYFLKINPKLAFLFDSGWTMLQWPQRILLKTDLAKWLHGFYASHAVPYPVKTATLRHLCGSECNRLSDFRGKLRTALEELRNCGALESWEIDQLDKVHVLKKKNISTNEKN